MSLILVANFPLVSLPLYRRWLGPQGAGDSYLGILSVEQIQRRVRKICSTLNLGSESRKHFFINKYLPRIYSCESEPKNDQSITPSRKFVSLYIHFLAMYELASTWSNLILLNTLQITGPALDSNVQYSELCETLDVYKRSELCNKHSPEWSAASKGFQLLDHSDQFWVTIHPHRTLSCQYSPQLYKILL